MTAQLDASAAAGLAAPPLAPAERTLPALLERQAAARPDKQLLRCGDVTRTFGEMRDAVAAAAAGLAGRGVGRGDRVAAMCANRVELLDLVLGCAWLGAVAVPVNTALRGTQLEHVLRDSGARALLVDGELVGALAMVPPPAALEAVWVLDGEPAVPGGYRAEPPPAPAPPIPAVAVDPGETAAILYTSGTTGVSKGVCCPHAQFYWWARYVGDQLELSERDVLYTCLPLFHTNALNAFSQALLAGASYVLGERFSASRLFERLADSGATVTYLLGAMVGMVLAAPPGARDRAHGVTRALAPATPAEQWEPFRSRFGVTLVEGYGSTETNCVIGERPGDQRPGYMGRIRPGFEARVVDEHDEEVPDGEGGELILRHAHPYSFATGYFGMPEQTAASWRNLWFHTGDRVVRDEDGWFRFTDRMKDAIRRRGENISAAEVERTLLEHPAIRAAAVFAVPSELAEDEVMAALVLEEGAELDPVELMGFCEPRLAYFAIPRYVEVVERLPLTENGKVRKAALRERGVAAGTWDRERAGYRLKRLGA